MSTSMLLGKSALVTGSASTGGLGYAIVKTLAAAGCNVGLHGIMDPKELSQQCDSVKSEYEVNAAFSTADLTKPAEIRQMMAKMHDHFGGVDILVNNAGCQFVSPVHEFPEDKWDDIISVCLTSAFHTTKAALPYMLEQKWGRIINTGSMHSLVASPYKGAYNAAKHGIAGLTKTVALETAQTGVTCNAICPGYMRTELIEKQLKNQAAIRGITEEEVINQVLLADQPTKKFVDPLEVGAFVTFLCSDAARSVTGSMLSIDGGWTAR